MRYRFLRFPKGKQKAVTFSYDDGRSQDVRLAELLGRYGMKGTFNLVSHSSQDDRAASPAQIREHLLEKGHEVALHGHRHLGEGVLRPIEGIQDVLANRLELEKEYGRIIRGMAYPDCGVSFFDNGADYESVRHYLRELDIAYARTGPDGNHTFMLPEDWYAWTPTAHHNDPEIFKYIDQFLAIDVNAPTAYIAKRPPSLFYLFGHSFEFDYKNNWEHMEEICRRLAFREDTWYATNIEICDYVTAYRSLIYSADGTRVYNPTLHEIWFDGDRMLYSVKPGETILCNR